MPNPPTSGGGGTPATPGGTPATPGGTPATPGGTPATPGPVAKTLSALGRTPLAAAALALGADVAALLTVAGTGTSVSDIWSDKKWYMVAAIALFLVAFYCNWHTKRATGRNVKQRRLRWGTATLLAYLLSLFAVIVGAAQAQQPADVDFGRPTAVTGSKTEVTVTGKHLTGDQKVIYRVEWDGDPAIDSGGPVSRTKTTATDTFEMGPVPTDQDVTGLAYVTHAGDNPPKTGMDCAGYNACDELRTTLSAAEQAPSHAEIGEPTENPNGTLTFTVKGLGMRADQKLAYRAEWDDDPAAEVDEEVPREGTTVTRTVTTTPVSTNQQMSVVAYITGSGGAEPAADYDCGGARGCAERHAKLGPTKQP